ncbi:uncharacterized protein G2W53_018137 [Senna tora]|uniref:Uncharacterized protein n=1 Tax=Senna tora TaxID=362788 RepID=A0A834TRG7_9FABA|nr:uncharacterized protein G2W53_018137 [Senna tora]
MASRRTKGRNLPDPIKATALERGCGRPPYGTVCGLKP